MKTHIVIHHSLTKDTGTLLNFQAIRRYHLSNGWDDIGYHYVLESYRNECEIIVGRLMDEEGAHCYQEWMNHKSIGICLVGNFDEAPPPAEQFQRSVDLTKSLITVLNIPRENIFPHRHFAKYKSCPGNLFPWEEFKAKL